MKKKRKFVSDCNKVAGRVKEPEHELRKIISLSEQQQQKINGPHNF